jgi:VIT1/CCC1 family predicted Fe2+/Mn2+ transporter
MQETARLPLISTAATLIALIAIGCSSGDERLVELSRQSTERQADQNRLVETNNRQVLEATNRLVEADAKSRTENIELYRQIEAERSGINQQRDALEQERRQIAGERIRDPIIAESIRAVAGLIAAILPLLVCLFLLRGLFHKSDQEALAEVLIEDLVSGQPLLREPAAVSLPGTGRDPRLPAEPAEELQDRS